jgi:signal peptidase
VRGKSNTKDNSCKNKNGTDENIVDSEIVKSVDVDDEKAANSTSSGQKAVNDTSAIKKILRGIFGGKKIASDAESSTIDRKAMKDADIALNSEAIADDDATFGSQTIVGDDTACSSEQDTTLDKRAKVIKIAKITFTSLLAIFCVVVVIFSIFSVFAKSKDKTFFGSYIYIVLTDSMEKTDFASGDLIFVKKIDPNKLRSGKEKLEVGDIISFESQNPDSMGETVTHKIREITTDEEGFPGFITYGTTLDKNDGEVVTYPFVKGRYVGKLAGAGDFLIFMQSTTGYFVCVFLPFFLLLAWEAFTIIKAIRRRRLMIESEKEEANQLLIRKAEEDKALLEMQNEELAAERKKLAEEKRLLEQQLAALAKAKENDKKK